MNNLVDDILNGRIRSIARALTIVENERDGMEPMLEALFPHTGNAWVIGVTGAPGTGKSSLVNRLVAAYRQADKRVGVIAIDPTSPFSGGAILGDRIRMREHAGDTGVFIRSMATRGSLGGLSRATRDSIRVLDAAGFDVILVETVGAGQSEVDIVRTAQTTIVVEAPGLGDDVQAIKAGILEIADVLVVNKVDRPGARNTTRALKNMLELGHPASRLHMVDHHGVLMRTEAPVENADDAMWVPPIVQTVSTDAASGIDDLVSAIQSHQDYLQSSALADKIEHQRLKIELYERLREVMIARLIDELPQATVEDVITKMQDRQLPIQKAVQTVLNLYDGDRVSISL
jgi:LAO/AO transport system kinase